VCAHTHAHTHLYTHIYAHTHTPDMTCNLHPMLRYRERETGTWWVGGWVVGGGWGVGVNARASSSERFNWGWRVVK
jgi:hypothetical protein